jgi:hypothetical protein
MSFGAGLCCGESMPICMPAQATCFFTFQGIIAALASVLQVLWFKYQS